MKRLVFVTSMLVAIGAPVVPTIARAENREDFQLVEATIADIQRAFRSEVLTPEQLVTMYLARIATYDQDPAAAFQLNSYLHVNEHAIDDARALNEEEQNGEHEHHRRGPLFGIPVILKDNIDTRDMPTTAGSVALQGSIPPNDAFIAEKLRRAGAIIMGKASLTEYANFISDRMPTGYDSQLRLQLFQTGGDLERVGYGFNPYDPRTDPRTGGPSCVPTWPTCDDGRPALATGGSSSGPGIAVSANLATVGVGTETSGSILSPGTQNLLVGIKPTVGLVSRSGIVPITADQDTAGPLARTVTDAAKLLGVLAGFDPDDPATAACLQPGNCFSDYTRFLRRDALRGARIAVPHLGYWTDSAGNVVLSVEQQRIMDDAIALLRAEGAIVEDPHDIPTQAELFAFGGCGVPAPFPEGCTTVLFYGFKRDLNNYLLGHNPPTGVGTLADVIDFNNNFIIDGVQVGLKYNQVLAIASDTLDTSPGSADTDRYTRDRAKDLDIAKTRGLDVVYQDFDAVLFLANRGANIAARAGYPSIVVPAGFVPNPAVPQTGTAPTPFPPGFDAKDAPIGVTFSGPAFSEPKLIGYAYAFEQATRARVPPDSAPPLPSDTVHGHNN